MIRHAAAIAFSLCLNASWLCAQSTVFTVNTASADVHKSPSTGGPVIGQAPRGTVLEVTRELGSWVKVVWPEGQDGVGYAPSPCAVPQSPGRTTMPDPAVPCR